MAGWRLPGCAYDHSSLWAVRLHEIRSGEPEFERLFVANTNRRDDLRFADLTEDAACYLLPRRDSGDR